LCVDAAFNTQLKGVSDDRIHEEHEEEDTKEQESDASESYSVVNEGCSG
jgi:hypothetical protein